MLTLTSNGFAWGAAALVAGYFVRAARRAPVVATALLAVATAVYYGLVLVVSQRWSWATLNDDSSGDVVWLLSVARAAGFWMLIAVGAGPVLGRLGHAIRNGSRYRSSFAAGLAFGLLAAEGLFQLGRFRWPILDDFVRVIVVSSAATVALSLIVTVILLMRRPACASWWAYLASAVVAGGLSSMLWGLIDIFRSSGFRL